MDCERKVRLPACGCQIAPLCNTGSPGRGVKRSESMVRKVILVVAALLGTGILASGCYEAKRHAIELTEYARVFLLDDDGMGTVGNIK